ncbi:hypothetical protein AURDEDRAFT_162297 [Auricularia subglabra TFB-10046 SS5]|nr:hypothetical protein AURDEDRAFT_162297 [Auricularia subglabra TFB-10046 SS5]
MSDDVAKVLDSMVASYGLTTVLSFLGPPDQVGSYNLITTAATGIFGPKLFRDMRRMLAPAANDPTFSSIQFAPIQTGQTSYRNGGRYLFGVNLNAVGHSRDTSPRSSVSTAEWPNQATTEQ